MLIHQIILANCLRKVTAIVASIVDIILALIVVESIRKMIEILS